MFTLGFRLDQRITLLRFATIAGSLVLATMNHAQSADLTSDHQAPSHQDTLDIKQKVEEFLLMQGMGAPGQLSVTVNPLDNRMKLASCDAIEAFMPPGSRAWGKTTVGVRCASPSAWTVYVQAKVSVMANYLVAAMPLAQGHVITSQDVMFLQGDLTMLPPGIFTDVSQVVGQTANMSLGSSTVLRQEMLRNPAAIRQGQTVRLVTNGEGFSISVDGYALANASDGQVVQARTSNGQVVSGIARNGGQVEVSF